MSEPHDPFSFDAEYGGPEPIKAAKEDRPPPTIDSETWGARGTDAPIVRGNGPTPFEDLGSGPEKPASPAEGDDPKPIENPADEFGPANAKLSPNRADISAHLHALFSPAFVKDYPDAWIEIAFGDPASGGKPDAARHFSAFELQKAAGFAERRNSNGDNVYVGVALRQGKTGANSNGRSSGANFLASLYQWVDFEKPGDDLRINAILKEKDLLTTMTVVTGNTPNIRAHLYFKLADKATKDQVRDVNIALKTLLGTDDVQDPCRVMRLAGTISYPPPDKVARGYVAELTTLHPRKDAPSYTVEQLTSLAGTGKASDPFEELANETKPGRSDAELTTLLEASKVKNWHNNIRDAIATMIGRGWPDSAIRLACAPYCRDGYSDTDLDDLIDGARKKWNRPDTGSGAPVAPANSEEFLALKFVDRHEADLRFVAKWGQWFRWDTSRWALEETLHAFDLARKICREAANACNKLSTARGLASAKTVAAVERLAKADRKIAATVEQWDTDPNKITTSEED